MRYVKRLFSPPPSREPNLRPRGLLAMRAVLLFGILVMLPVGACYVPLEPEPSPDPKPGPSNKCGVGYCWIRSASVCCPSGFLNYAGAGYGCYASHQACVKASGKCWYETSCIP